MRRTRALVTVAAALLEDPTARHWGYELTKRAGVRSGVLYPILTRMLDYGWLEDGWETREEIRDKRPPRRYYRLTGAGETALARLVNEARADARFGDLVGGLA